MAMSFSELQTSVQHALGDSTPQTLPRIKRWINDARNMIWEQIHGEYKEKTDYIQTTESYVSTSAITVAVTEDSTSVTSDGATNTAFTTAMVGRFVQLNGTDPWYVIAARPSATELTLADAYVGDTDTACAFEVHTYRWALPADFGRLLQVTMEDDANWSALEIIDRTEMFRDTPLPLDWSTTTAEVCWLDEQDSNNRYLLGVYPVPTAKTLIKVRYEKALTELSGATETIGIPGADMTVLAHTLFAAFTWRNRTREATLWGTRFERERDLLLQTAPRSKAVTFRRRDHSNAARSTLRRPNLGGMFPR
jgi:hypothetical protein